ncbi:hypothetical protein MNBD_GAMMA16-1483 [hydrothermal vent metagenome]|uniref:Glutathione S-transferase n=1 Tax=hydrothermal vent metagenome TaxID=652676 RepID=A0A3B0Z7N9_9ZZZZ
MIKLYGMDASFFSNKVKMTANALELEYEFVNMDFKAGDMSKPEYLAIHPAGKIPGMDDDGFTLFESNTIIKYLADKKGNDLYPKALKQRAVIDQWTDFSNIHIGNAISKVLGNKIFAPMFGMPVDEQSMADGLKFFERFLPIIDTQLGKNKYLASDILSLADITLFSILEPCEVAELDLAPYNNVVTWRNALKQQKFYTDSFTSYEDSLKAMAS